MKEGSKLIFSDKDIQNRISCLSNELNNYYLNETVVIIGVLNGCFMFIADLVKKIDFNCEIDFVKVSTYKDNLTPINKPSVSFDGINNLKNKNILIVDDIVDSGSTINYLYDYFGKFSPKQIKSCCLVKKGKKNSLIDWIGFNFSGNFIYGYGMDYMSKYRNLNSIYEISSKNE